MKKKLLECPIHGLVLHRCKRINWHTKPAEWSSSFKQECYLCLAEGKNKEEIAQAKRSKFISLR